MKSLPVTSGERSPVISYEVPSVSSSEVEKSKKLKKYLEIQNFAVSLQSRSTRTQSLKYCGNSSVGRARPCQGRGREFESRFPLQTPRSNAGRLFVGLGWEPRSLYVPDNQTLLKHGVPNLSFSRGVGNYDFDNVLTIKHLITCACQT